MNEIIKKFRTVKEFKAGDKEITILCYADNTVLITDSEDNLLRLLNQFVLT